MAADGADDGAASVGCPGGGEGDDLLAAVHLMIADNCGAQFFNISGHKCCVQGNRADFLEGVILKAHGPGEGNQQSGPQISVQAEEGEGAQYGAFDDQAYRGGLERGVFDSDPAGEEAVGDDSAKEAKDEGQARGGEQPVALGRLVGKEDGVAGEVGDEEMAEAQVGQSVYGASDATEKSNQHIGAADRNHSRHSYGCSVSRYTRFIEYVQIASWCSVWRAQR